MKNELDGWGLKFAPRLSNFPGRILRPEKILQQQHSVCGIIICKSPPTMWWWRLIVFAESTRRHRHLFLLSLENPYSDYFQIFAVCILALGNLSGNFFFRVFQFLQQNPRWPPKSYGAR